MAPVAIPLATLRLVLERMGYTAEATEPDCWVMTIPGGPSVSIPRLGATVGLGALHATLARVCLTPEGLLDVWQQIVTKQPPPSPAQVAGGAR
jgi:hypothetical protein